MNLQFYCPECKNELSTVKDKLCCNKCSQEYVQTSNCVIFNDDFFPVKTTFKDLIKEIDKTCYESAVKNFLITNPSFKPLLVYSKFDKSADIIFHGLGRNTSRCLEIKSELGNRLSILSNIFQQIYSIEFEDEYIELQKRRFNKKICSNVSITKCNLLKLPFPDNYFDMVLCNGVLDNINNYVKTYTSEVTQKNFILELKRVINDDGCIIFGVENKHGFKTKNISSYSELDFSKIKNKSTFKMKTNSNKKNQNSVLKYGFSKYRSLLENNGLNVKPYWILTSYNRPHYSGSLYDDIAIKWLFKHLDVLFGKKVLTKKIELTLSLLNKLNFPFASSIMKFFSPYFVFYCSKTSGSKSIEDWIKASTKFTNILRISHRFKNIFILINSKGESKKVVYVNRHGDNFPDKIDEQILPDKIDKNTLLHLKEPSKRIWMANWLNGHPINTKNENEILAAINWLIELQNNTIQERMTKNDIIIETSIMRKKLDTFSHKHIIQYNAWLDQYDNYFEKNLFYKTTVHGSFGGGNVLFDPKTKKINVIDWEDLSKKGNSCNDFVRFLFYIISSTSKNPLNKFKECLEDEGDLPGITPQIENKINMHFGFKLNLRLLLRYYLIKMLIVNVEDEIID